MNFGSNDGGNDKSICNNGALVDNAMKEGLNEVVEFSDILAHANDFQIEFNEYFCFSLGFNGQVKRANITSIQMQNSLF